MHAETVPWARLVLILAVAAGCWTGARGAADPPRPAPPDSEEAQRHAMARLAFLDGTWRGTARAMTPTGQFVDLIQTERAGPMLGGAIRVVEGRGYGQDGSLQFNAFAVMAFDAAQGTYTMRSHANGRRGDFALKLTETGFVWEIPAGPAVIRYTATVADDEWVEVGERLVPGQPPMRTFEMRVKRVGSTGWPADGAVMPR